MQDKKTQFRFFTITQYEKEQDYLSKMHKAGWKFTGVNFPGFYHFAKCEPEEVIYQLDYNQEGIDKKAEYVQMFQDCGWEYLMDFVGYSYFRKPAKEMKEDEGIFCDDHSRLEMMNRVFKGRIVPLIIIFFWVFIPQILLQDSWGNLKDILSIVFCVLFVLYVLIFIQFAIEWWNFKKNIK